MSLHRAFASSLVGIATLLAVPLAAAQSVVIAGHAKLQVPSTFTMLDELLKGKLTGGDSRPVEQRLVVLSSGRRHPVATLVLSATGGGGRYQWHGGCEGMKSDATRFVHHPFHVNREECVYIAGPYDLDGSIDSFAPGARALIAWSLSFGEQLRKAMQSISGEWELPPLE